MSSVIEDPNSPAPWFETKPISRLSEDKQEAGWQAMFACQIGILPFKQREQLKWGFNAAVLLEEALDRQKLFLEAQLHNNPVEDQDDRRALALRCIGEPGRGLILSVIGKTLADSRDEALQSASNYLRETLAIFPYDYSIHPAATQQAFERITGRNIFEHCTHPAAIAQLQRFESPLQTSRGIGRVMGVWQTKNRSDEQIWRALAHYPHSVLLNVLLIPTLLFERERQALLEMQKTLKIPDAANSQEPYLQQYEKWIDPFLNRFVSPWNKLFYLQVHLVSAASLDEYLLRSIGSAITRDTPEQALPGFQVRRPASGPQAVEWSRHIESLNILHTNRQFLLPRLSDVASLDEAHAVFRFPYPLEGGFPNTVFVEE